MRRNMRRLSLTSFVRGFRAIAGKQDRRDEPERLGSTSESTYENATQPADSAASPTSTESQKAETFEAAPENEYHQHPTDQALKPAEVVEPESTEDVAPDNLDSADLKDDPAENGELYDDGQLPYGDPVVFNTEDPEDYTDSTPRLVMSTDGVMRCPALLMTFDLSQRIQGALCAEKNFAKAERMATREMQILMNYESDIKMQIGSRELKMMDLRPEVGSIETSETQDHGKLANLEQEHSNLQQMLEGVQLEKEGVNARLESQATMLREIQREVNVYFEDAFVAANILPPYEEEPEALMEEYNLEAEYQKFVLEKYDDPMEDFVPLHMGQEHLEVPAMSPEDQARQELIDQCWAAKQALKEAQYAFDNRENERADAINANADAVNRGEVVSETVEEFDIRWYQRNQELTHDLIEAEAAFTSALQKTHGAGIEVSFDDQSSCFASLTNNGYRMSEEQAIIAHAPVDKVNTWLSHVATDEVENADDLGAEDHEGDDWEAETVGINDSASFVAEGSNRKKIDKWRQICGL